MIGFDNSDFYNYVFYSDAFLTNMIVYNIANNINFGIKLEEFVNIDFIDQTCIGDGIEMQEVIEFLKYYLLKDKKNLVLFFSSVLVLWAIGVALPYISGIYIDHLIDDTNISKILMIIIMVAAVQVLNMLNNYGLALVSTQLSNQLHHNLSIETTKKILQSRLSQYRNIDVNALTSQLKETPHI